MAQIPPRQVQIRDAFAKNWITLAAELEGETEASRHGESAADAGETYDRLVALLPEVPPQAIVLLQASVSAAVATVNEFCGEAG